MEDEAGYVVLTPRPCNEISVRYSQAKKTQGIHTSSRWYKTTLWILGASCVMLGLGVIVLSVFVFQCSFHKEEMVTASNATLCEGGNQTRCLPERSPSFEDVVTYLKDSLCESSTESAECKLCPMGWLLEKEKCQWFSDETRNWLEAHDSCSKKNAQMIVFQDLSKLNFTQNVIRGNYRFWIGLKFTAPWKNWTWVDGSLLNQTLFPGSLPMDGQRCGVLKGNKIRSEMCSDQFKWICERDPVIIEQTALKRVLL